jgi:hypothetical protein
VAIPDDIRRRLAAFASSRRTRTRAFTRDRPCDWQANSLTDPRSNCPFTEDGAWEYVAEQIIGGIEIEVIELEHPPGKRGYVMKLPSSNTSISFYVKLQLGSNCVFRRSFHLDYTVQRLACSKRGAADE